MSFQSRAVNKSKENTAALLALLILVAAMAYGWGVNIVELASPSADIATAEIVVRILGILLWPVGVILGYM